MLLYQRYGILSRLPKQHIQIMPQHPVLVVSIGIQLRVSITVGQAIDRCFLPCRGAPTYPPRSLNSGRTHFPGSCPASAKQYAATRPRLNREVKHAGLNL